MTESTRLFRFLDLNVCPFHFLDRYVPRAGFRPPPAYNYARIKDVSQSEIIFSVQESPEGGFEARTLGFSIFTEADSLDELKTIIRDAVSCHFEPAEKPSVIRLHMVKDEVIPA
jgi:hypothetical protein